MPRTILFAILAMFLSALSLVADDGGAGQVRLVVDAFPQQGPAENLEPEVLDFRYQPGLWQACLGLPDDPYKTIVGSDGGLYYEYGKRGPEPYGNGQGSFGTRVLAELQAEGERGPCRQSLHSPRIPIVATEWEQGEWLVRQEAWSGALHGETLEARTPHRVDHLWLTVTNRSREPRAGTVALHVGSTSRLQLDDSRTRLVREDAEPQIFCQFSRPSQPLAAGAEPGDSGGRLRVEAKSGATVTRNWARPAVECAACFRHVLVGFGQPLDFRFTAAAGREFRVALGLIEGWHAEPGKRPVRVQVEGQPARTLDLVKIEDGIWNYAASFYAHAHLWLGHGRKAAATMYAFGNHAAPLLCWREEQNPVGQRPHYVGDMPHNWASAEFIRLVRHLLILERGRELHLLEGLPRAWMRPGCVTELKSVPTTFGDVSLRLAVAADGRSATLTLDPPQREPVEKLVVHLEHVVSRAGDVSLDGKPLGREGIAVRTDRPTTLQISLPTPNP